MCMRSRSKKGCDMWRLSTGISTGDRPRKDPWSCLRDVPPFLQNRYKQIQSYTRRLCLAPPQESQEINNLIAAAATKERGGLIPKP